MFKDCLKELYGYDSILYGIHSPRAGGATVVYVVNSNNSILKDFSWFKASHAGVFSTLNFPFWLFFFQDTIFLLQELA